MAQAQTSSATAKSAIDEKKCQTPEFRVSYPSVFKAKSFEGQEAKFSIVMLFPKATDLKALKRAAFNAATEKWGPKEKWPKNLRLPFRDGNERKDSDGYEDHTFVGASSKTKPGVVNQRLQEITEASNDFYAGCYARATLIAFAYDKAGNRGVSFSLQNIQKLRDGKPFSGRKRPEEEFEAVEVEEVDTDLDTDTDTDGLGM